VLLICPHSEIRTFHPTCKMAGLSPWLHHTKALCTHTSGLARACTYTHTRVRMDLRALSVRWVRWEGKNIHATHTRALSAPPCGRYHVPCWNGNQQNASDMRSDQRSKCNASDC
jgi:hypothetical protein